MSKDTIHGKKTVLGDSSKALPPFGTSTFALEEYSVQKEIGRGGMAVVYEAVEKSLNRTVALKVLSKELGKDKDLIKRFVYEAQSAARLSHPNIVQIYSIGEEDNVYYFAMEYVRGLSVEDLLVAGKKFSVIETINVVRQAILALKEAYKAGIIHRDIKPGNILVANNGVVKVADFGLAAEVKIAQLASGGRIVGTPLYMSPEQAQGKEGDHRSDMYSLGITLYQMLTGMPPYISSDTKELIKSQISKALPALPASLPAFIIKLINRLTNKDPRKRYADYETLLNDLDAGLKNYLTRRRRRIFLGVSLFAVVIIYAYNLYQPIVDVPVVVSMQSQDEIAERAYQRVAEFVRNHPEASDRIIKRYIWIINKYPDTAAAASAEEKLEITEFAKEGKGKKELQELNAQRSELVAQGKYQELIDEYTQLKYKYRDSEVETLAQGYIGVVRETAFRDFGEREKEAVKYLANEEYDKARAVYRHLMTEYQMPEIVNRAKRRLSDVDNLEEKLELDKDAKNVYFEAKEKVDALLAENNYQQAKMLLEELKEQSSNQQLRALIDDQMAYINELYQDFKESAYEEQYQARELVKVEAEIAVLLSGYKFAEAKAVLDENVSIITVPELTNRLNEITVRIDYLLQVKNTIIDGVNSELIERDIKKKVTADQKRVLMFVTGGYVGLSWNEVSAREIYGLALKYMDNEDAVQYMALGVFCFTYGLDSEADKEFAAAVKLAPDKKVEVEGYLKNK